MGDLKFWVWVGLSCMTIFFSAGVAWGITRATIKQYALELNNIHELYKTTSQNVQKMKAELQAIKDELKEAVNVVKEVPELKKKVDRALYEQNGITVYMPRDECTRKVVMFTETTSEIKKLVQDMDQKREDTRNEMAREFGALAKSVNQLIGRLDIVKS